MCDRVPVSTAPSRRPHWWQRPFPSFLVFVAVLAVIGLAALVLWGDVAGVLDDVGRSKQGEDPWEDPVGVEQVGPFQVVHIPDCAAAPVVRIALWDEDSKPYWEVSGDPTPMETFAIGIKPEGFVEETPFRKPPRDAMLRLVVVRKVKGVAGVRFRSMDVRTGKVVSGIPLKRYTIEGFQTAEVCAKDGKDTSSDDTSTTAVGG
jgi:hypothetical protein